MDEATLETVESWLEKALSDLQTARKGVEYEPITTDTTCFHAQQCMEKCLKAYIASRGDHIPKAHDLSELLTLCTKHDMTYMQLQDNANNLTDYAVTVRYPGDYSKIPIGEARRAVSDAEEVMKFVKNKISLDR